MPLLIVDLKKIQPKLVENPWDFQTIEETIKKFIYYAKNSGYTIEIIAKSNFIEDIPSYKAQSLQVLQIDGQILREKPHNLDFLIEDFFRYGGIKIFYPTEHSRIVEIATYASKKQAIILSSSKKFAQSKEYDYKLFRDFNFDEENKQLKLSEPLNEGFLKHKINIKLAKKSSLSSSWVSKCLPLKSQNERLYFREGIDYLKEFENPHVVIKPLRQALYHLLNVKEAVFEGFPVFYAGVLKFKEEKVQANGKFKHLLFQPDVAIEHFFPKLKEVVLTLPPNDVKFYFYNVISSVLELCSVAMEQPLIELLRKWFPIIFKGGPLEVFLQSQERIEKLIEAAFGEISDDDEEDEEFDEFKEEKENLEERKKNRNEGNNKGVNYVCKRCQKNFFISEKESTFILSKGWTLPKRCKKCRFVRRNEKNYQPKKEMRKTIKMMVKDIYCQGEASKKLFKDLPKKEKFELF